MPFQTHLQQVLAYLKQGHPVLPANTVAAGELNSQTPPTQGAPSLTPQANTQGGKPIAINPAGPKKIGGM